MITTKAVLRKELLLKRKNLSSFSLSYDILCNYEEFKNAKVVFCYVSSNNEVDTFSLLDEIIREKTLTVPYCTDSFGNMICVKIDSVSELSLGHFGILEPKNPVPFPKEKIDFAIVPGIAFDKEGYRLGYGKGYYDRFLSDISPYKLGVCKKELLEEKLPHDEFDIKMNDVLPL